LVEQFSATPAGGEASRSDPGRAGTKSKRRSRERAQPGRETKTGCDEFQRALNAGEMPPLRALAYAPDYSPTDIATLLQAGGVELLSAKTLITLRESESLLRGSLSRLLHYEKLSDGLIAPNLGQEAAFFYDPDTKKLRKQFEFYVRAQATAEAYFRDMEEMQQQLLDQIQAERQRR
jgi:hypothetical protein